jgi:hypothetical protein
LRSGFIENLSLGLWPHVTPRNAAHSIQMTNDTMIVDVMEKFSSGERLRPAKTS